MQVSVDISYYPFVQDFIPPIDAFIDLLNGNEEITVETGKLSTVIMGDYSAVMDLLKRSMGELMEKYPSMFVIKLTNYCPT